MGYSFLIGKEISFITKLLKSTGIKDVLDSKSTIKSI
jgi:hypothetical protein